MIVFITETECVYCAVRVDNLVYFKGLRVGIHLLMWPMVLREGLQLSEDINFLKPEFYI